MNIVEQNWGLQPSPHSSDVSEPQSLEDSTGENKNHFMRSFASPSRLVDDKSPAVVLNLSYDPVSNANVSEYYTYDRYAKLVKM